MTRIEPEYKVIKQNALDFHLRLEIAGANLVIEDLNIDVEYVKTRASNPNKSTVTIWNIADDTFKRLLKNYAVDVYSWYGNDEPSLLFRGYIDPKRIIRMSAAAGRINTAKGFLASTVKQDNKGQFDIPTVIELIDSKINYMASKINKTYFSEVNTNQLINDCIEAMGVGVGFISKNLPVKIYKNGYKLIGKPHIVLKTILNGLGAKFNVTNSFIYIQMPTDKNNSTYAVVLNPQNSMQPDQQSDDTIIINTQLIPFLNANDWIKLDFKELQGLEQAYEIRGKCNNYGTAGTTDVVIKVPIKKEKKKRKKRGRKAKRKKGTINE